MNKLHIYILVAASAIACEKIVEVKVNETDPYLVVDAWLTHTSDEQIIRLTTTQPYYDNSFTPGVTNAVITVTDDTGETFNFNHKSDGNYSWSSPDTFGVVDRTYFLEIEWNGTRYFSSAKLERVPAIDSITFTYQEKDGFNETPYYYAEFFSTDPAGEGDAYWLKVWKNGVRLNKPEEIYYFYDASFSDGNGDGVTFIFPIRILPNPFESDINGNYLPPYWVADTFDISLSEDNEIKIFKPKFTIENNELVFKLNENRKKAVVGGVKTIPLDGNPYSLVNDTLLVKNADSIYLELHSVSDNAWFFLNRLQQETNRPGGFGALFATPPANLPTNISTDNEGIRVAGIFNIASVAGAGRKLTPDAVRMQPE